MAKNPNSLCSINVNHDVAASLEFIVFETLHTKSLLGCSQPRSLVLVTAGTEDPTSHKLFVESGTKTYIASFLQFGFSFSLWSLTHSVILFVLVASFWISLSCSWRPAVLEMSSAKSSTSVSNGLHMRLSSVTSHKIWWLKWTVCPAKCCKVIFLYQGI